MLSAFSVASRSSRRPVERVEEVPSMGREWFSKQTLGSLVDERARRHGDREALVFQGRRWTFAEVAADVDRVARGLIGLGGGPGDTGALRMMNGPAESPAAAA